jgi:hypothetical protein
MSSSSKTSSVPAPVVALAAWLVPGAGYLISGQRARGLTVGIAILSLFVLGCLIGGARVVDAPEGFASPFSALMQKPWFIGQILAGPITLITASIAKAPEFVVSHARVNEIGTLYTAIAGMLNLLAIIDSTHRATAGGRP